MVLLPQKIVVFLLSIVKMTLDDIQDSIFLGDKAIEKALNLVNDWATKHNKVRVKEMARLASLKRLSIPVAFSNQIATTQRYKDYIKTALHVGSNVIVTAVRVIDNAEQDSNRRILAAKEADTRRNRQFEKNTVTKFFKGNYLYLTSLIELYIMFNDIKKEINATH